MIRVHVALLAALALTAPAEAGPPSRFDCSPQWTRLVTTPPDRPKQDFRNPSRGFDCRPRYGFDSWYYRGTGRDLIPPAPDLAPITPPPLRGAGGGAVLAPRPDGAVAWLTIEFPTEARVWVNDEPVSGQGRTLALSSLELPLWTMHTFRVEARWEADGQSFEWERTVDVLAGRPSRVAVARGFPVKD